MPKQLTLVFDLDMLGRACTLVENPKYHGSELSLEEFAIFASGADRVLYRGHVFRKTEDAAFLYDSQKDNPFNLRARRRLAYNLAED
jgi:hypothetical protein